MRDRETTDALTLFVAPDVSMSVMTRPAYYRTAIAARITALEGRRSWDAYRDVFAPAYDDTQEAMHDVVENVAVAVAMVEWLLGEPPPPALRTLIDRGVRAHGKAILYGYNAALAVVVSDDPTAIHRYALAVVKRLHHERTAKEGTRTADPGAHRT